MYQEGLARFREIFEAKQYVGDELVGSSRGRPPRRKYKKRKGSIYQKLCFMFDEAPSFAETEVSKKNHFAFDIFPLSNFYHSCSSNDASCRTSLWPDMNLLVRRDLFKKKLTPDYIANHLGTAVSLLGLNMKHYRAVIYDRVAKLNDMYPHVEKAPFYCWTRTTFSNAGNKMNANRTTFMYSFRKKW